MVTPSHLLRASAAFLFFAGFLAAAPEMAVGIFRGSVEGVNGTPARGQLTARAADGTVATCNYDSRSYFEMDKARINATKLQTGDSVWVVADHRPGSVACYTRMLRVVLPEPPRPPSRSRLQGEQRRNDLFQPGGDRTISGIVVRHESDRLTLRTRQGDEATLSLLPGTRYLGDGLRMNAGDLAVNMRVSVRAGRNLRGELEAYQVVWGGMLDPH
jgi:hypothetical protein